MEKVKKILLIVSILLFCLNYQICEFFFADDLTKWWDLKINIYSVVFACILLSYSIGKKGWFLFIVSIGVGLTVSNMIDKVFFNVHKFTQSDILMILTTIILSSINLIRDIKNG